MIRFKFFGRNNKPITRHPNLRRWIGFDTPGSLYWLTQPTGILYYMEAIETDNINDGNIPEIRMEMRSIALVSTTTRIESLDGFMEDNMDKIIMAYQFIDESAGGLTYDQESFHNMPRDRPLIFRGIIKDRNVNI